VGDPGLEDVVVEETSVVVAEGVSLVTVASTVEVVLTEASVVIGASEVVVIVEASDVVVGSTVDAVAVEVGVESPRVIVIGSETNWYRSITPDPPHSSEESPEQVMSQIDGSADVALFKTFPHQHSLM